VARNIHHYEHDPSDSDDVDEHAALGDVIDAVEQAFAAFERGTTQMPTKSYIDLPQYNGDFRSMPAYLDTGEWDAAGLKWVNVHRTTPTITTCRPYWGR